MGLRRGGAPEPRTRRTLGCHARAGAAVGAARPGPEQQCVRPPHGRPSALGRLGTRGRGDSSELRQATGRSPVRSTLKRKPAGTGTVTAPQRPRLDPRPCARAAFHGEAGSAPKMALRVLGRGPGARSMAQRPPRKTRRELGEGSEGLTGLGAVCTSVHLRRAPLFLAKWVHRTALGKETGQEDGGRAETCRPRSESPWRARPCRPPTNLCTCVCARDAVLAPTDGPGGEGLWAEPEDKAASTGAAPAGSASARHAHPLHALPSVGIDAPLPTGSSPQGEHGAPRQLLARPRSAEGPTCRAEVDTAVRGGVLRWHLRTLITATATLDHGSTWPGGDERGLRDVALPLLT